MKQIIQFSKCLMLLLLPFLLKAQENISLNFIPKEPILDYKKQTNVIYQVDKKTFLIQAIYPGSSIKVTSSSLKNLCYQCHFYEGTISGSFVKKGQLLIPGKNAILTIHKKNLLLGDHYLSSDQYFPGDQFYPFAKNKIGALKTKLLNKDKTQITMQVN